MFKLDKLETMKRALLSSFFLTKETNMVQSNTTGSKYFKVGSQNQQILAKYWGTGKTAETGYQGRPALEYSISRRRVTA